MNVGVAWHQVEKKREIQPEMHSCVAFGAKKKIWAKFYPFSFSGILCLAMWVKKCGHFGRS